MAVESTLAIVKPDAFAHADDIIETLKTRGFVVAERETITLTSARAADFYREHAERPFFKNLTEYMSSGPSVALVLRKSDAIADLRKAIGPTDPAVAKVEAPDSLRAKYGVNATKNSIHASDSAASSAREIQFFFPNHALGGVTSGKAAKDYLNANIAPVLTKGLQEMCVVAPIDPLQWLGNYLLAASTVAQSNKTTNVTSSVASKGNHTPVESDKVPAKVHPKIYFVLGNAGAGKGTQCAKLVEKFGFVHLSAGDLLRAEVVSRSPEGELIESYIKEGKIVPGEVTLNLLRNAIEANASKPGILVDGFPRAMVQAGAFERTVSDFEFCLFFDCPEAELESRLLNRGRTSGRSDDNVAIIRKRFDTFRTECYPVIQYYEAKGKAHRIDSTRPVDEIFDEVCSLF